MARRRLEAWRCTACFLRRGLCVCAQVPRLDTRTRLLLVLHEIEREKPTNTGRLAALAMPGSRTEVRGNLPRPEPALPLDPECEPVVLFPSDGARPLSTFGGGARPVQLIVLDGTWPQAVKMRHRIADLGRLPCAHLPEGPALTALRRASLPGRTSTLEAVAHALRALEAPEVGVAAEAALLHLLRVVVDRTRWTRGQILAHEVTGGLPPTARQHDPWT